MPSPNPKNFQPYGKIIHYPNKAGKGRARNLWRIVHTEHARTGWRVAYLVLRDKTIGRMECHPSSDETFEPVKGRALIFVALKKDFKNIRCFTLDKPLVVRKGVWHGLVSFTPETEIKITENNRVTCRYWPLGLRLRSLEELRKKIPE